MKWFKKEGDLLFFYKGDLDLYGLPEQNGFKENYLVVEEKEFVLDWKMEIEREFQEEKKIHRYDRLERFETCLGQLLGDKGRVDFELENWLRRRLVDESREGCWICLKKLLREYGYPKYYNRIPRIIYLLFNEQVVVADGKCWFSVMQDFSRMSEKFDSMENKRNYFLPLRYCALMLLMLNGARFNYYIPLVLTPRKRVELRNLFDLLY